MIRNKFEKIISLIITISFVLSPAFYLFFPQKTQAQRGGNIGGGGIGLSGVGAVALNCATSRMGPMSSFGDLARGVRGLFGSGGGAGEEGGGGGDDSPTGPTLPDGSFYSGGGGNTVPVSEATLRKTNEQIRVESEKIRKEEEKANYKEKCLDAMARFVVLKIIDKITLMTVEWINSGFDGNPFYPKNRPNFFEQIARDEIGSFVAWFGTNPRDYPFGKLISETILLTVQRRFEDNMRYSMDRVLSHRGQYAGYDSFTAQFSVGGWAGYSLFAQPNNNIFGNYLLANQYMARRTAGTGINIAEDFSRQLWEGTGVMNQRKCAKTAMNDSFYTRGDEYIPPDDPMHMGGFPIIRPDRNGNVSMSPDLFRQLPPAVQDYLATQFPAGYSLDDPALVNEYNFIVLRSTCTMWETVTPGRFIADQTTQVLGSPLRNLELGDELNENLGLIFDALLNQLVKKGLSGFSNRSGQYSSNPNDPNYNALWAQINDPGHGSNYNQPPLGDIITGTGVDMGLIQIQRSFITVAEQNIQRLGTLIRDVRTLDYCVPGPNPNWYTNSVTNFQNILSNISPPFSTNPADNQAYYRDLIQNLVGINIGSAIENHTQFTNFMTVVFNKFSEAMLQSYSLSGIPPSIKPAAVAEYNQIPTYQSSVSLYQNMANNLNAVMPQLIDIQTQVQNLPPDVRDNPNSPEIQTLTSLLSQISSQGVLVDRAQYDQAVVDGNIYDSKIGSVNRFIMQCIEEVTAGTYSAPNERVPYPFVSITDNPSFGNIPNSTNRFLSNKSFTSTAGANNIDLSGFVGATISISPTSTEVFANTLQAIF